MAASITLAHLSDIHFRHQVGGDTWDLDADLRNELGLDLERVVQEFGPLRALLVTGDVAFSGQQQEYDRAAEWLAEITRIARCHINDVWMVPGNHDVHRKVVSESPTIQEFHAKLRNCDLAEIDELLYKYLVSDTAGGEAQLSPLANYVAFATRYECSIESTKPYWTGEIDIGDSGYVLKMRGLTSPLISDGLDNSDGNRMVVGSFQASILREPGTLSMSLSHHPPTWIRDGDTVEEILRTRARIQLWGHRHAQRTRFMDGNLHLYAGAVHPQRNELDWEPRYNIIRIGIEEGSLEASVTLDGRVWNRQDGKFGPDFDTDGERFQSYTLALEPHAAVVTEEGDVESKPAEVAPQRDARRSLAFAFTSLPYQRRLAIAGQLDLLDEATGSISDQKLFEVVLSRAVREDRLRELWEAVQADKGGPPEANPFADNGREVTDG